jgi:four helix bundle protein
MFPFENLEVYKKAFSCNQLIYNFLKTNTTIPSYLKNQLGRASLSIMLNIAEGSGRSTNKDRKNFFINARGSVFECASIIDFLNAQNEILPDFYSGIKSQYEEISKMLYKMIQNLSESIANAK